MDIMDISGFDYAQRNTLVFSKTKDDRIPKSSVMATERELLKSSEDTVVFSDVAKNMPNTDFRNMTNRELIITAMYLESTGAISTKEASVLRDQVLGHRGGAKGRSVSSYYDLDSPNKFDFVSQIMGAVVLKRSHVPEGDIVTDNPNEIEPLESALEKILAMSA